MRIENILALIFYAIALGFSFLIQELNHSSAVVYILTMAGLLFYYLFREDDKGNLRNCWRKTKRS